MGGFLFNEYLILGLTNSYKWVTMVKTCIKGRDIMQYGTAETAKKLNVSMETIKRWRNQNIIKAVKVVGRWKYEEEEIKRLKEGK